MPGQSRRSNWVYATCRYIADSYSREPRYNPILAAEQYVTCLEAILPSRQPEGFELSFAGFNLETMTAEQLAKAKSLGFSDRQIAHLTGTTESEVRAERQRLGLVPSYRLVDTCAAEFEAYTPYYYSTYDRGDDEVKPSGRKKVMILGGGPNRIGQGIEFDYCCVHASFALKEDGFETLMVNSNPETVSTDYDTSDKLYFEPLTLEDVLHIYEREKCRGAIAQFGGQTPLNLALGLQKNGVNIIGTSPRLSHPGPPQFRARRARHADRLLGRRTAALHALRRRSFPGAARPGG